MLAVSFFKALQEEDHAEGDTRYSAQSVKLRAGAEIRLQRLYTPSQSARAREVLISKGRFLQMYNPSISDIRIHVKTVIDPYAVKDPRSRGDSR